MLDHLTDAEKKCLSDIKRNYGLLFHRSGIAFNFRAAVIAGICMRESHGGPLLDKDLLGDGGHGHGLFQIDDRSFPEFCADPALYKNPITNTLQACKILRDKRSQVQAISAKFGLIYTDSQFERMWIAGYNCGANQPVHALRNNEDLDTYATGKDYSAAVVRYAAFYESDPTPEGDERTKGLVG